MNQINRQAYSTDLKDTEWQLIAPLLPQPTTGRPRLWPVREILNAILYIVRSGCAWRLLPHDLPPWQTVYTQFRRWRKDETWEKLNLMLVKQVRQQAGREPQPSAVVIDSQSAKSVEAVVIDSQSAKSVEGGEDLGVDVYKQTHGRKRHIVVDTQGLLLKVVVHSASVPDGNGGKQTLQALFKQIKGSVFNRWCRLKKIWADGAYEDIVAFVRKEFGWALDIVRRPENSKGFVVLPRRWVVERTFAWLIRSRRLARDYERRTVNSEAMIYVVSTRRMLRLLTTHP